jgi:hypothetical protein
MTTSRTVCEPVTPPGAEGRLSLPDRAGAWFTDDVVKSGQAVRMHLHCPDPGYCWLWRWSFGLHVPPRCW